jgi:hypothetical protein
MPRSDPPLIGQPRRRNWPLGVGAFTPSVHSRACSGVVEACGVVAALPHPKNLRPAMSARQLRLRSSVMSPNSRTSSRHDRQLLHHRRPGRRTLMALRRAVRGFGVVSLAAPRGTDPGLGRGRQNSGIIGAVATANRRDSIIVVRRGGAADISCITAVIHE